MPSQLDVEQMPDVFNVFLSDSWGFPDELKGLAYLATTWHICSELFHAK